MKDVKSTLDVARADMRRFVAKMGRVMMLPATVAHEATHAVVAVALGGKIVGYGIRGSEPHVDVEYPFTLSHHRLRACVGCLAPFVFALLTAPIFLGFVFSRPWGDPIGAYVLVIWFRYGVPLGSDIRYPARYIEDRFDVTLPIRV